MTAKQTTERKPQRHKRVLERRSWFSSTFCFLLANRFSASRAVLIECRSYSRLDVVVSWNPMKRESNNTLEDASLSRFRQSEKNTWLCSHRWSNKLKLFGPFANILKIKRSVLLDSLCLLMIYILYHCGNSQQSLKNDFSQMCFEPSGKDQSLEANFLTTSFLSCKLFFSPH